MKKMLVSPSLCPLWGHLEILPQNLNQLNEKPGSIVKFSKKEKNTDVN